ncbi:putative Thylakoid lumenal 19 kDa protein, chloroplastic [Nannochloris sp. 'desiccata']|nr:putative Thylakoid lumenal 19 kDa protein, chloroplastic [Chlorella desiccata (nom. nud.)]
MSAAVGSVHFHFTIFYGTASPPTSYGGYGGNAEEDAKYKFEYPTGWKTQAPNKVEKGTQGIDCRVFNPRNKSQAITVVTFGRAGEDNKSFKVTDIDTTIAGFAGADYDLQDALSSATDTIRGTRELDGETYFDIQVDSPDVQYLCSVTVKMGKVFALFVKCPTKSFKQDEEAFRHVVETFRTI